MPANRIRLLVIVAVLAVGAVALVVGLGQCGARPAPATTTPGATASTVLPGTATMGPGTPVVTSEPTPTLTEEQQLARELIEARGQITYSADDCRAILETEPSCSVVKSAIRITRPEWEELFSQTDFYLVKTELHDGGEFLRQPNWLIVEQNGQRYTAESFDRLLEANGITSITDENRELVARALVLMTLSDYLEEEIAFSEFVEGDWPAPLDFRYNYALTVWTKIQGLSIEYHLLFEQGRLRMIREVVAARNTGDHINVSLQELPGPSQDSMTHSY